MALSELESARRWRHARTAASARVVYLAADGKARVEFEGRCAHITEMAVSAAGYIHVMAVIAGDTDLDMLCVFS